MPHFEILTSLPPYGPPDELFSWTGHGRGREGFVVRFADSREQTWVGNFQPGGGRLSGVIEHPDGYRVMVIARGQGYIVDPNDRQYRDYFGGDIEDILPVPNLGLLFGNGLWFEAIGPEGLLWTSDRISWHGMQGLSLDGQKVTGESWDVLTNTWIPFELDIDTGRFRGGSFADWRPA